MRRFTILSALLAVSFETASIKQNTSANAGSFVGRQPGGRFMSQNATALELIQFAYRLPPFQVTGGPGWVRSDRWDIVARLEEVPAVSAASAPEDALLALQSLLAERFKLVIRRETQQLPIFALVVARTDGRLGPQLTRPASDCIVPGALQSVARAGGIQPAGRPCGLLGRVGSIQSIGSPLSEFVERLAERVQRSVVDRTGLTGAWDFTLTYSPEASQIAPGALAPGVPSSAPDPNQPSLFTALQEQLGLKLESTRGAVEILVIDRIERPTED